MTTLSRQWHQQVLFDIMNKTGIFKLYTLHGIDFFLVLVWSRVLYVKFIYLLQGSYLTLINVF